jgi:putative adenylate-forming enzyme
MNMLRNVIDYWRLNHQFYHFSPQKIQRSQEKSLLELVQQVRAKSPFYRDLYAGLPVNNLADFSGLPTINKSVMMANFDRLNTAGLHLDEVMAFAVQKELAQDYLGYFQDRYVIGLSSGTSGNKGIFVTPKDLTERLPGVFLARGGVRLSDLPLRILFILRVFSQGFSDINGPLIQLNYRSSMTEPQELIETCNQMRANILMAPPSLLRQLIPHLATLKTPLRRVITYAEVLNPLEKSRFSAAFRAPVVEIYQASEGQIASPCRYGNLHINEDLVYIELLDENDRPVEPGQRASRMLVTNLVNHVQPLIRYEMNDLVELGGPCPCGSHFRVISQVIGRNDDVLYLRTLSGTIRPVYPDLVSRWIITTDDQIREFIVEQTDASHLLLRLDLTGQDSTDLVDRLRERLMRELAAFGIACTLDFSIERIPLPADNSKRKRFISRLPNDGN